MNFPLIFRSHLIRFSSPRPSAFSLGPSCLREKNSEIFLFFKQKFQAKNLESFLFSSIFSEVHSAELNKVALGRSPVCVVCKGGSGRRDWKLHFRSIYLVFTKACCFYAFPLAGRNLGAKIKSLSLSPPPSPFPFC